MAALISYQRKNARSLAPASTAKYQWQCIYSENISVTAYGMQARSINGNKMGGVMWRRRKWVKRRNVARIKRYLYVNALA